MSSSDHPTTYDRRSELESFDATKLGVKGLVDAGVSAIPRIFHHPPAIHAIPVSDAARQVPVIDLTRERRGIVEAVGRASAEWGFFQVVGHGVPAEVLRGMVDGVRRFSEGSVEEKQRFYTRERGKKVQFNCNFDLFKSKAANWRDTLFVNMMPEPPPLEELPEACREILMEYSKHMAKLGETLFELLSEALGLKPEHLKDMECCRGHHVLGHYYPPCIDPTLTLGTSPHSDPTFLTVLLQDQLGGLQVLHEGQWVDVPPMEDAFVVNMGDLLQLISNDKFTSVEHRVVVNRHHPRISVACFFMLHVSTPSSRIYKPIEELVSKENPPHYKEVTIREYEDHYYGKGLDGKSSIWHFRLDSEQH